MAAVYVVAEVFDGEILSLYEVVEDDVLPMLAAGRDEDDAAATAAIDRLYAKYSRKKAYVVSLVLSLGESFAGLQQLWATKNAFGVSGEEGIIGVGAMKELAKAAYLDAKIEMNVGEEKWK